MILYLVADRSAIFQIAMGGPTMRTASLTLAHLLLSSPANGAPSVAPDKASTLLQPPDLHTESVHNGGKRLMLPDMGDTAAKMEAFLAMRDNMTRNGLWSEGLDKKVAAAPTPTPAPAPIPAPHIRPSRHRTLSHRATPSVAAACAG